MGEGRGVGGGPAGERNEMQSNDRVPINIV